MRTKLRGKITLLFMILGILLAIPAVALADQLGNDLDTDALDADFEAISFTEGDSAQTVNLALFSQGRGDERALTDPEGTNDQTEGGCNVGNLNDTEEIEVQAISSGSAASVKWAATGTDKVKFAACSDLQTRALTVTPGTVDDESTAGTDEGTANVTFKITSTGFTELASPNTGIWQEPDGSGRYDLNTARFTVNVTPPPNTAPTVLVTGVEHAATYDKGAVPTAGCSVTDTEDGLNASTTAASPHVTSNLDSDGLGTVTVDCSYTDGGNLTTIASATYTIRDPSAPVIGYTLDPANPDGDNGWYKGDVDLTWNVSEPQSPNSLVKTGCVDQTINADQAATTYSCPATSSGGSTGPVTTVAIKRDGTLPSVVTNGTATGTQGSNSWYTSAVSQPFQASDLLSGLVGLTSPHNFSIGSGAAEGSNVSISSGAFSDNAGNTNSGTSAGPFKIDLTDPTTNVAVTPANPASTGWYNLATGAPTADFSCADVDGDNDATNGGASGVATCPTDVTFSSSASAQGAQGSATDNAGRSDQTPASVSGIKVDLSEPTNVQFSGGPAANGSYDPDSVPTQPTCTADDTFSNLKDCVVTGYSANAGSHTMTATATDNAGNVKTATRTYEVKGWTLKGFYHPVDMLITNTVKAGQTVPLKFEMVEQVSGDERTNPADVKTFTQKVTCGTFTPTEDAIEEYSSGSTSLRYDSTGGQFIFNWQTPKAAGSCFKVTLTPNDTSSNSLVANFKLK